MTIAFQLAVFALIVTSSVTRYKINKKKALFSKKFGFLYTLKCYFCSELLPILFHYYEILLPLEY